MGKGGELQGEVGKKIMESGENVPSTAQEVINGYEPKVKGMKSVCGVIVGDISCHAAERIAERGVSLAALTGLIKNAPITYSDRNPARVCQQKDNWKIVFDRSSGAIITVVDLDS